MKVIEDRPDRARTTIVCCVLAAICEGVDLQSAGVAAGGIIAEFHPGADSLGTFFTASTIGLLIGALFGGRLSDSIGRKKVLVGSVALFGIFSLLTPIAWDINSLSAARLLTGLGLGGALPNLLALTNECSSIGRRRANVALVYAGNPIGGAIASLISLSIDSSHWRWIFIVGGIVPLLLVPIMQASLRDAPQFDRSSVAYNELTAAAGSEPSRGSFLAVFSDGRATATVLLWVSFFLGLLTLYLLLSWLPTLLTANGLSAAEAAGAQIAFNVGGAIAALSIGQLLEGRWRVPSVLLAFLATPALIFALAHSADVQLLTIVGMVFFLGCAVLAAQAFLYAEAPTRYPAGIRGIGIGAAVAAGRLGAIAGPKLGGLLKAAGHNSSQLLIDVLPLVLASSVVAISLLFYRTHSKRENRE